MRLSDLQLKMVVNVKDGKHLGNIIDADITDTGQINFFIVAPKHFFKRLFKTEAEVNIKIAEIVKIGTDVILVEI